MKANAPEKIYVHVKDGKVRNTWNSEWIGVNDIEYIHKDAFIDKAATWFANRYQANGSYLNADDIEDFTKYMKGE